MVCWHTMRRTTVKLPDDVDAHLRHEAKRRGTTVSALTREAIESFLGMGQRRTLRAAGAGRSGQDDISERIEEILRQRKVEFAVLGEQHVELERRLAEHLADPGSSVSWEEVRRKLKGGA